MTLAKITCSANHSREVGDDADHGGHDARKGARQPGICGQAAEPRARKIHKKHGAKVIQTATAAPSAPRASRPDAIRP